MTKTTIIIIILHTYLTAAFGSNVLKVSTDRTSAGGEGRFSIVIQNDVTINGLNFILKYNPNIITPINVTPLGKASILTGPAANFFDGDKISFLLFDMGSNYIPPDSGEIFEVGYVVSASITDSTLTQITFLEGIAADSNLAIVSFEYIDGWIQINPVGVNDTTSTIPRTYQLFQNYPNPFNSSTTILYDLPEKAKVTLKIYNILGQQLVTLVNEVKDPGAYRTIWNARGMASGVYFYRLRAGGFVDTKKILLLK